MDDRAGRPVGKVKSSRCSFVTLVTLNVSQQILPSSHNRVGILFFGSATGRYTLANEPVTALDMGINVPQSAAALVELLLDRNGDCVQREWYAMPQVSTTQVGVIEIFA